MANVINHGIPAQRNPEELDAVEVLKMVVYNLHVLDWAVWD
jgi:hypothetical protein